MDEHKNLSDASTPTATLIAMQVVRRCSSKEANMSKRWSSPQNNETVVAMDPKIPSRERKETGANRRNCSETVVHGQLRNHLNL